MQIQRSLLYAILAGIFLITIRFIPYPASFAVKALPILLLLYWVLRSSAFRGRILLGLAVLFSAVGDVVLDLAFQGSFIAGLVSFLIAHIFYVILFARDFRFQAHWLVITLAGVCGAAGMAAFLWPHLGTLKGPVAVYVSAIAAMFITAVNRSNVNIVLVAGAAFFLISDSILALNRFYSPVPAGRYAIMATYYLAQYLIVTGYLDEQEPS